jgi:hypothetical protein
MGKTGCVLCIYVEVRETYGFVNEHFFL